MVDADDIERILTEFKCWCPVVKELCRLRLIADEDPDPDVRASALHSSRILAATLESRRAKRLPIAFQKRDLGRPREIFARLRQIEESVIGLRNAGWHNGEVDPDEHEEASRQALKQRRVYAARLFPVDRIRERNFATYNAVTLIGQAIDYYDNGNLIPDWPTNGIALDARGSLEQQYDECIAPLTPDAFVGVQVQVVSELWNGTVEPISEDELTSDLYRLMQTEQILQARRGFDLEGRNMGIGMGPRAAARVLLAEYLGVGVGTIHQACQNAHRDEGVTEIAAVTEPFA